MTACSSCGHDAPDGALACPDCGAQLTPPRRAEERRVVTTLFCDLVGFTALSERNDAEVIDAFLRRYYAAARRVVESYGGVVEKYIGDAVVAVFGVPTLHEDDPERAVRAGLRLVDEIDALPGIGGEPVEVRVGVNTGETLVRLDVEPASGEGFLTGDAVNVAARLQAAAPPMAVAVGEATHAVTENVFAFDACHPVTLKGKRQPLQVWIATAPLARTGSELRSFTTSFVGREAELGALEELLHRTAEANHAELALIVGEPGIGKSRLLAEFARRLDDESTIVTWRQGRCLPFGSNVTFWALSEIVRACAGILESDGVARTEARLETVLPEGHEGARMRARLRPLLGLEAEEASREENFAAWRAFLEMQAARGPTVLVVEDLHWADGPMLAFLDDLARNLGEVPLLLLATGRQEVPEFAGDGAGFVSVAEHMPLGPLSGDETGQLILTRLGAKSLPVSLRAALLERSGGNPLFAEELVRLLEDRDLLENRGGTVALRSGVELPMPDSIGALIAARLDLLAPERKALLADAAVVGRSFWPGAVAAVGGREPAEVLLGLHELVAKELVSPVRGSSIEGETEFLFVHALVCDVAYAQLTRADRAVKHAALARWLEERSRGSTEDMAEILAYHYGTALEMATSCGLDLEDELMEPTSRYLALAGGRAAPLDASAAAAHFARAERVTAEASRPRRWLLSRRTRRAIKRRSPILLGITVVAVLATGVTAVAWMAQSPTAGGPVSASPRPTTAPQMAAAYGPGVVRITGKAPMIVNGRFTWKDVVGTGFVANKDGVIFTSSAVFSNLWGDKYWRGKDYRFMEPAFQVRDVTVAFFGNTGEYKTVRGFVFGFDAYWGGSYIYVDPKKVKLTPLPLGDSETIRTGAPLVALSRQGSIGLVSQATAKVTKVWRVHDIASGMKIVRTLRVNAKFPQGNDNRTEALPFIGSPLLNAKGRVVAVVGPDLQPQTRGQQGVGCAEAIRGFLANLSLFNQGYQQTHTWLSSLGATCYPAGQAKRLGIPVAHGIVVEYVYPGEAADRAGVRGGNRVGTYTWSSDDSHGANRITDQCVVGGDVIVAVDGKPITGSNWVAWGQYSKACDKKPGDSVRLTLLRGNRRFTVTLPLEAMPYRAPSA